MAFLFYFALLAVWPLLLWPALHLKGWPRAWLWVTVLAGLLATGHEIRMYIGTTSAIRLDIPLIAMALAVLYGGAAVAMFLRKWRKTAACVAVALMVAGGGLASAWIEAGRESERLSKVFDARNALLFEAKFRSPEAYSSYFRMFETKSTSLPVGHWEAQGGGYFSRLIVNPEGWAWAFYPCGETECAYSSVDPGVQPVGDLAARRWDVTLAPRMGAPVAAHMAQPDPDHLTIEGRGQPTTFTRTPPPIDSTPSRSSLVYLGPFVTVDCRGQHVDVRQLWLWQEGTRLYAVGIISTLVAGTHAGFVSPILLGEGERQGDAWTFDWQRNGQTWNASITLDGPIARLVLARDGGSPAQSVLAREPIFHDEAIELAPLTSKADWDHWFDIVLVGHFSSGDVPPC